MVLFSLGVTRLAVKHLCARFLQLHLRMKPFLGGPYICGPEILFDSGNSVFMQSNDEWNGL